MPVEYVRLLARKGYNTRHHEYACVCVYSTSIRVVELHIYTFKCARNARLR